MDRIQHLVHKGNKIFCMDFSMLKNVSDIKQIVEESIKYIRKQPFNTVFTLTVLTDMHFSNEIKDIFSDFVKGNKPYVKAGAVVGLSGLQTIVYNGLMKLTGRDIKSFHSINEAKDWLGEK